MASTREALGDALRDNRGDELVRRLPTDTTTTVRSKHRSATEGTKEGELRSPPDVASTVAKHSGQKDDKTQKLAREVSHRFWARFLK